MPPGLPGYATGSPRLFHWISQTMAPDLLFHWISQTMPPDLLFHWISQTMPPDLLDCAMPLDLPYLPDKEYATKSQDYATGSPRLCHWISQAMPLDLPDYTPAQSLLRQIIMAEPPHKACKWKQLHILWFSANQHICSGCLHAL